MLQLVGGILSYFLSSLGGVAIVKFLNYRFCFESWELFALLSRSTWLISLLLHFFLQYKEDVSLGVSWYQLFLYFWIALGLSVVELFNSYSMSSLPGSFYALLKGSDVGFSMVLSWLVLGKRYQWGQICGSLLVMGGISLVYVFRTNHAQAKTIVEEDGQDTALESSFLSVPALLCLLGAFLNAACSVLTEAILKEALKTEEAKLLRSNTTNKTPSKLFLSNAYSMWTTFFAFLILLVPVVIADHKDGFQHLLQPMCREDADADANAVELDAISFPQEEHRHLETVLGIWLTLLMLSRFVERIAKYWICVADSAVTFSFVQAARRLSGVFLLAALFRESFPPAMTVGSILCASGFALHAWFGSPSSSGQPPKPQYHYEMIATHHKHSSLEDENIGTYIGSENAMNSN